MKTLAKMAVATIAAAAGIVSCSRSATSLKTMTASGEATETLFEGSQDSIRVSISLEYPVKGASKDALEAIKGIVIGISTDNTEKIGDPQEEVDRYIAGVVSQWRDTMEADKGEHYPCTWEHIMTGQFVGEYRDIVSYLINDYEFAGGAHGMTNIIYLNMSLRDGQGLHEDGVFTGDYSVPLGELLSERLAEIMDPEDYDMLFVKDIEPNDNFYVSSEGVTFVYGQYEIGPYALGVIEVPLMWAEIKDLVWPAYR